MFVHGQCHAHEPTTHQWLTQGLSSQYPACLNGQPDALGDLTAIAKGSYDEDTGRNLGRKLARVTNWHFYDSFREKEQKLHNILFVKRSLHFVFRQRVENVLIYARSGRIEEMRAEIGGVLHYIQDMTSPAHVAPIYHDPINSDSYEAVPWLTMNIPISYNPASCMQVGANSSDIVATLEALLDKAAQDTLYRLQQPIPAPPRHYLHGKTWEIFWKIKTTEQHKLSGFSSYGELGGEGFEQLCNSPSSFDRKLCLDFAQDSFTQSANDSLRALLLINNALLNQTSAQ